MRRFWTWRPVSRLHALAGQAGLTVEPCRLRCVISRRPGGEGPQDGRPVRSCAHLAQDVGLTNCATTAPGTTRRIEPQRLQLPPVAELPFELAGDASVRDHHPEAVARADALVGDVLGHTANQVNPHAPR